MRKQSTELVYDDCLFAQLTLSSPFLSSLTKVSVPQLFLPLLSMMMIKWNHQATVSTKSRRVKSNWQLLCHWTNKKLLARCTIRKSNILLSMPWLLNAQKYSATKLPIQLWKFSSRTCKQIKTFFMQPESSSRLTVVASMLRFWYKQFQFRQQACNAIAPILFLVSWQCLQAFCL